MFILFLCCLAGGSNIAVIVTPLVVALIVLGSAFSFLVLIRVIQYCLKSPLPITIRFSNKNESGSLAKMLKVFKVVVLK